METSLNVQQDHWTGCLAIWEDGLRSTETRRAYIRALRDLCAVTGLEPGQIGVGEVAQWVRSMRERKLSDATIVMRISAVSSFFRFAMDYTVDDRPLAAANPARKAVFRRRIVRYAKGRALASEDASHLLSRIDLATRVGKRDYALLLGYLVLGRRNTEWRMATVGQFEQADGGTWFVWSGKGHQNERISVPSILWDALRLYVQESGGRGPFDYIFLSRDGKGPISMRRVGQILRRYQRLAGIHGRLRVHDLRHTAAMLRREAGADVEEIRNFLGHSMLATTQYYLHRLERVGDDRATAVADMLHIRGGNYGRN